MAVCTLDLSRPCFVASLANIAETDEAKQKALAEFKDKIEKDPKSCHRVVQKFYGNKKFTHLRDKIWKYDWGESSASSRKAWRMVVVVPEPDKEPLRLVAAAVYAKSVAEQLSFRELAAIFDSATNAIEVVLKAGGAITGEFRRVSNGGDGKTRSICCSCYSHVAVTEHEHELDAAEAQHNCEPPTDESA